MSRTSPFVRLVAILLLNVPFVACGGTPPASPPATPTLISGALIGSRACGNFQASTSHTFDCSGPLPTTVPTGWELKPLLKPPNAKGTQWPNRVVVLTVGTATATNLNVDYVTENGIVWRLNPIPDGPNSEPAFIRSRGEYAFAVTDDGTNKRWTLKFVLENCDPEADLRMSSSNAAGSSGQLRAVLLRVPPDPNDPNCFSTGGGVGFYKAGPSVPNPTPQNPPSGAPCPGGGQQRFFGVCENCSFSHPPDMNRWSGGMYCSEADVRAVYGYTDPNLNPTPKAQTCTFRIEPNRDNCEVP